MVSTERSNIRGASAVIEKVDAALALFPTFAAESVVPAEEVQFIMRCIEEKRAGIKPGPLGFVKTH